MTIPTVHRNGSSAEDLIEQLSNAGHQITMAIEALCKACPNGRDYYPQSPHAIKSALQEHQSRIDRLKTIYDELTTIAEAIQAQES